MLGAREFFHRVLIVAGVALAALMVWRTYEVLLLAFAAVLLATLLRAVSDFLVRHTRLPAGIAFACAIVLLLAFLAAAGIIFGAQVSAQVNSLAETLPQAVQSLREWMRAQPWLRPFVEQLGNGGGDAASLAAHLGNLALTGFDAVAGAIMVIFGAVYFGAQPQLYRRGIVLLFPPRQHRRVGEALDVTVYAMRRWLLGQIVDMAVVGGLTGLGLWAIGVPSAFALGLLSGLASFVPYIGPIASGALAVLVASAQSLELGAWALGLYVAVQQIEGHLVMPFVHRWTIALPPALAVFAVVGMGYFLGPLGLLLATPLTVVVFVLVKQLYLRDTLGEEVPIRQ